MRFRRLLRALPVCLILAAAAPRLVSQTITARPTPATVRQKSATTALLLSLGATVIPALSRDIAIVGPALLIGPALGHFYAGNSAHAWAGMGIRGALGVGTTVAIIAACNHDDDDACGVSAILIGGGAIAASAIFDIITAPRAAQRWNALHAWPIVVPTRNGPGIGVQIGF